MLDVWACMVSLCCALLLQVQGIMVTLTINQFLAPEHLNMHASLNVGLHGKYFTARCCCRCKASW
jgi:hypothetical protein